MLIEGVTGIWTGSIYNDPSLLNASFKGEDRQHNVVAVKTHGPWKRQDTTAAKRAVVLIRNPSRSIPSSYSWLWAWNQVNVTSVYKQHQIQALKPEWEKYRDNHFDSQLDMWLQHLRFWRDSCRASERQLIAYEDMVNAERGPAIARELRRFLNRSTGTSASCIWDLVLNKKSHAVRRKNTYHPKLRPTQNARLEKEMRRLAREFEMKNEGAVALTLRGYAEAAAVARTRAHKMAGASDHVRALTTAE